MNPLSSLKVSDEMLLNMTQTTFQNKRIKMSEISHQHLSNCYWHNEIIKMQKYEEAAQLRETEHDLENHTENYLKTL